MNKRSFLGIAGSALALIAAPMACGGTDDSGITAGPGDGGVTGKGGSGKGGSANGTGNGGSLNLGGVGQGGGSTADASCVSSSKKADLLPLDLYIMLDRSGSMGQGTGRWEAVTQALDAFVKDPTVQATALGVGLDFFPDDPECDIGTYSTPSVPIAVLPGVQPAISSALASTGPSGGTPTYPAMGGALTYAQTYAIQNPNHVVVIVLATDGSPNDCYSDVGNVSGVAAQGVSGTPKILTFVIGIGNVSNLDQIAASGGTNQAFIVNTSANVTQQFLDALNAIRGAALACEYLIPQPDNGEEIDPNKVNVQYTPGSGGSPETFPSYPDAASCPPSGDGWYYDNNAAPTKILLCPGSCNKVKADPNGKVDVIFGCLKEGPA